jgi:azurin/glucose/arabinose dehydrogenase
MKGFVPAPCLNLLVLLIGFFTCPSTLAFSPPDSTTRPATEEDYYRIETLPIPEGVVLEVGGMTLLPDSRLAVSTRRGEVWLIENPYLTGGQTPFYKRFAYGLWEPLGLAYRDGSFYLAQRGELTRLQDTNKDGKADVYETIYSWPLTGNYHEYSYGPLFLPNGNMLVSLNLSWVGRGASLTKWRGWMLQITPDGKMFPWATGMRSPAGFGLNSAGDIFYAENQGDWVGSGRMTHVEQGDFTGHPDGLRWTNEPGSPLKIRREAIPSTGKPLFEIARAIPELKPPAVWFPHSLMGISTSDIREDTTGGGFGPFSGQLFVGDQGHSKIMRVFLEKVDGQYQGVCFPFREGFSSGILRMIWGKDHSMFVGMTSRGWAATGAAPYGLQRLVWTGKTPFEMKTVRAMPDGFEIEFTLPLDPQTAADPASYQVTGFTYQYHSRYGSPIIDQAGCPIRGVVVSEDGMKVRLVADSLREGYIHEIKAAGVLSESRLPLLHNVGYYTLNSIPRGERLVLAANDLHHNKALTVSNSRNPELAPPRKNGNAKRVTSMPDSWTKGPDMTIAVGTQPGLQFDVKTIQAKPGSKIKLVFNNNDDMLHNFVLTTPESVAEVGDLAAKLGLKGAEKHYIPETDKVLYHTNLLQPETSEVIYFTAPTEPGEYTYVCTVPGHSYVMRGTLRVVK